MENTMDTFKAKQSSALAVLKKLQEFLELGSEAGIAIDPSLKDKLDHAVSTVAGEKLKVALVGGFSEGKTAIAAAWLERLDKSTMNISHQESSNAVSLYEIGEEFILIDTPGLFGFKEQENAKLTIEQYKDITKKYVSEAHLILYVMDPANPIKESHRDDLTWLFRTLNLLPRTVFVLSRFDQVGDVEDPAEYRQALDIKQANVTDRLTDLVGLTAQEAGQLSIVGVAANPFDLGTEHWLANMDQFRALSHIASLQSATAIKVATNGGTGALVQETRKSVIRDVLNKQLPVAIAFDDRIGQELDKLEKINVRMHQDLRGAGSNISDARAHLRNFVAEYFADLNLQCDGVTMETFGEFFEREVGSDGVMITVRLQNEFERHVNAVSQDIRNMQISFDAEISHYNSLLTEFGKQGINVVIKGKFVNSSAVLAARDGIVTVAKALGVDLARLLKFKPWGAVNLAKGINTAFAVLGLAMEAWDSWEEAKRRKAFQAALTNMKANFNQQRAELIELIGSGTFTDQFFPGFVALERDVEALQNEVEVQRQRRARFQSWRALGDSIKVEFAEVVE